MNQGNLNRNLFNFSQENAFQNVWKIAAIFSRPQRVLTYFCHGNIYILMWFVFMMTSQMETFSTLLALCAGNLPVTGEFPSQRPVTQNFDVLFDLRLNKRLNKQSIRRWFETPSHSLWRSCNIYISIPHQHSRPLLSYSCIDIFMLFKFAINECFDQETQFIEYLCAILVYHYYVHYFIWQIYTYSAKDIQNKTNWRCCTKYALSPIFQFYTKRFEYEFSVIRLEIMPVGHLLGHPGWGSNGPLLQARRRMLFSMGWELVL